MVKTINTTDGGKVNYFLLSDVPVWASEQYCKREPWLGDSHTKLGFLVERPELFEVYTEMAKRLEEISPCGRGERVFKEPRITFLSEQTAQIQVRNFSGYLQTFDIPVVSEFTLEGNIAEAFVAPYESIYDSVGRVSELNRKACDALGIFREGSYIVSKPGDKERILTLSSEMRKGEDISMTQRIQSALDERGLNGVIQILSNEDVFVAITVTIEDISFKVSSYSRYNNSETRVIEWIKEFSLENYDENSSEYRKAVAASHQSF